MTYSDVIILRLNELCHERGITVNKLANMSGITQIILSTDPSLNSVTEYFRAKIIPEIGTDGRESGKYQRLRHCQPKKKNRQVSAGGFS